MDWKHAQRQIRTRIRVGTDVNTPRSTYRFIKAVDSDINNQRYGYHAEEGFVVPIGQSTNLRIPWSILSECFVQLNGPNGYDGEFFEKRFPLQDEDHTCYVHVIGQIFVAAGIAYTDGKRYRMLERHR